MRVQSSYTVRTLILEDITGRHYGEAMPERSERVALAGFLLGASGMFATMYSTQAILPELGQSFGVGPARAGLTVSVLIFSIALGAWLWGPISDRIGRRRTLITASALLVVPAALAPLAPTFGTLLACRVAQGLCMPGLLTVGVPYVMATFGQRHGARVMGWYVGSLVVGGLIGRVGVSLLTAVIGWRGALGAIAFLPLVAAVVMQRSLPREEKPPTDRPALRHTLAIVSRNRTLLAATALGCGLFFSFVGIFSYAEYRLQRPPFSLGTTASSLIFLLWLFGAVGPLAGRVAERFGWRRVALVAVAFSVAGALLTLPASLPSMCVGLGMLTIGMFAGATSAQLGVATATRSEQGVASAFYFSAYYSAGALGGWIPGLAWQAFHWDGVIATSLVLLAFAAAAGVTVRVRPSAARVALRT
jgi:YNFM family putative membrane transporter